MGDPSPAALVLLHEVVVAQTCWSDEYQGPPPYVYIDRDKDGITIPGRSEYSIRKLDGH